MKRVYNMLKRGFYIANRICNVCWYKTIRFNFTYFKYKTALKLPVWVYRNVNLMSLNGEVKISSEVKRGMIRLGHHEVGTLDMKYERTVWQNNGLVIFNGQASIGSGTRLSVNNGAMLKLGNEFCITGRSILITQEKISFGDNCLLSWDVLIMDTDFHKISNTQNALINSPKPIVVGNNVWICCRSTILKGVTVVDDVVVAAGSTVTKNVVDSNVIIGGNCSQRVIRRDISWER